MLHQLKIAGKLTAAPHCRVQRRLDAGKCLVAQGFLHPVVSEAAFEIGLDPLGDG